MPTGKLSFALSNEAPFFVPHDQLGFIHPAGCYQVSMQRTEVPGRLTFSVETNEEGFRRVRPQTNKQVDRAQLWVFGCSFSWGCGIENHETFPWLLQEALPEYAVGNWSICGYGTVHYWIQLQRLITQLQQKASCAIFTHADFHPIRNVAHPSRLKEFNTRAVLETVKIRHPRALLHRGNLHLNSVSFEPWNLIETTYQDFQYIQVTQMLYYAIFQLCREYGIQPVLATLSPGAEHDAVVQYCKSIGFETVDCSIDWNQPGYNNGQIDTHPNATLHRIYAQRMLGRLNKILSHG